MPSMLKKQSPGPSIDIYHFYCREMVAKLGFLFYMAADVSICHLWTLNYHLWPLANPLCLSAYHLWTFTSRRWTVSVWTSLLPIPHDLWPFSFMIWKTKRRKNLQFNPFYVSEYFVMPFVSCDHSLISLLSLVFVNRHFLRNFFTVKHAFAFFIAPAVKDKLLNDKRKVVRAILMIL